MTSDTRLIADFEAGANAARAGRPRSVCTLMPHSERERHDAWQAGYTEESRGEGPFVVRHATADHIRARPLREFIPIAAAINGSDPLMAIYAAPEWDCLSDDGKLWVAALVREAIARWAGGEIGGAA